MQGAFLHYLGCWSSFDFLCFNKESQSLIKIRFGYLKTQYDVSVCQVWDSFLRGRTDPTMVSEEIRAATGGLNILLKFTLKQK